MLKRFFFVCFVFLYVTSPTQAQQMLDPSNYTPAACRDAGGTCSSNDANCNRVGGNAGIQYDILGYCDTAQTASCCKIKSTSTGPGTDDYCINTEKGTCYNQQTGCQNGGLVVGTCSTIPNINSPRICCSNPTQPSTTLARGAFDYTLLEEIPNSTGTSGDFSSYLQSLYKFTFWAIGIAALFMLTVGGFMYITSAGNTSRIGTAKTIIVDSILGIIIALFAWLFLYVLNPDLVENLALPTTTPGVTSGGGTPGGETGAADGQLTHTQAVAALGSNIGLSSTGNCSDPNNKNCTSLEGVPASVIQSVNKLASQSGCSLIITGGTETGHQTHGPGRGSIDIREDTCLGNFLHNNLSKYGELSIQKICATATWFNKVGASCTESGGSPHFHIQFAI